MRIQEQLSSIGANSKRLFINYNNNRGYNPGLCINKTTTLSGAYLFTYRQIKSVFAGERIDLSSFSRPEIKQSTIIFCGLDSDYNILWERDLIELSSYIGDIRCMPEDGRLFWWNDRLFCSYTRAVRNAKTYSILKNKQSVVQLYPEQDIIDIPLDFGFNNEIYQEEEKNWQFFSDEQSLRYVYQIYKDHIIVDPFTSRTWKTDSSCFTDWYQQHGTPHGGTPPILLPNGEYLMFFNSYKQLLQIDIPVNDHSIAVMGSKFYTDKLKREYRIGAYCFKKYKDSYQITKVSKAPFLIGTAEEGFSWASMNWKPLAVFATGAILEHNNFKLAYGINDCWSEIATLPYDCVMNNLQNVL